MKDKERDLQDMRFKNQDTLISLRLPKEVDAKIDYLADQKWSDKSSIYREAIRDYLKKDEVKEYFSDEYLTLNSHLHPL
jgi:predicted DNA-binding protein